MTVSEMVRFVGKPDGPMVFVPEIGRDVGTFEEMPGGKTPALRYHIPLKCRGPFRPEDLANFDPEKEYRTDSTGYLLCYESITDGEGNRRYCKRKAVNRFPRCNAHGGRLHPLDKVVKDEDIEQGPEDPESLSRYQLYLAKQINVDDLDDEEIMNFGFRAKNGQIFKPKNITREMVNAFTKSMYERSLDKLQSYTLEAVKTLATIMMDDQVDAPVRLKASTEILDRTIGKATQTVKITQDAPWELVLEGIATVSREESRRMRGEIVEGEVVSETNDSVESSSKPQRNLMKELEQMGKDQ